MTIKYCCRAGVPDLGGARCQEEAIGETGRCAEHQDREAFPKAAHPTIVLIKMTVNPASLPLDIYDTQETSFRNAYQVVSQAERYMREASEADRNPYRYGNRIDSGAEAFCGGVRGVSLCELHKELQDAGLGLVGVRAVQKLAEAGERVVIELRYLKDAPRREFGEFPMPQMLEELLAKVWQYAYVYCNIPRQDTNGTVTVLHTVNAGGPQTETAKRTLRFANGDWDLPQ